MSEEKLVGVIRDFAEAYVKRDVKKMLSFLTDDVIRSSPEGIFKGKEEVKRYLTWDVQIAPDIKLREAGIGIVVKGNKAVWEWVYEGSMPDGRRWREIPGITVYMFSGEKIQQYGEYYDRLSMAKQVAKGWLEKKMVGTIVNRWEKGLH